MESPSQYQIEASNTSPNADIDPDDGPVAGADDIAPLTEKEKERENLNRLREEVADLRIGQQHLARIVEQLWKRERGEATIAHAE